ncbi:MAG: HNH endonuclease signature motif containing protein, partial [Minicystis sp.]
MTATSLPALLRRLVRERAALRCEYCLLAEEDAFLPHEPDHLVALKHGGATEESNLALACFLGSRYKGSDLASLDPETGSLTPLFHPRVDLWSAHFAIERGVILPKTPSARVTVTLLRLNLPVRVEVRGALAKLQRWPGPLRSAPREGPAITCSSAAPGAPETRPGAGCASGSFPAGP